MSRQMTSFIYLSVGLFISAAACETVEEVPPSDTPGGDLDSGASSTAGEPGTGAEDVDSAEPGFSPSIEPACGTKNALSTCLSPNSELTAPEPKNVPNIPTLPGGFWLAPAKLSSLRQRL